MVSADFTVPHVESFTSYMDAHDTVQRVLKDYVQPLANKMFGLWVAEIQS